MAMQFHGATARSALRGSMGMSMALVLGLALSTSMIGAFPAAAQDQPVDEDQPVDGEGYPVRLLDFVFYPTHRAQIAVWIESADGTRFQTVALTQSVSQRGIGNRPGALQMNSGFRWPYGRREGTLPVWAHRRAEAANNAFPRVIFQDRTSEGHASRSSTRGDFSRDEYYCLSFDRDESRRDGVFVDGMTCASVFNSDKGRYITPSDVAAGYAEPFEMPSGQDIMRPLSITSLYPPRRDVMRCEPSSGCHDHADVALFKDDAKKVMPDIDAVTMATPVGRQMQRISHAVPADWPPGEYVAYIEVNVEGDYNEAFNETTFPTPTSSGSEWDFWAKTFGYPYRGQPSVVYAVALQIDAAGGLYTSNAPIGYGDLHGATGELHEMDNAITMDPLGAPGSGADRLLAIEGDRFQVRVRPTNVCTGTNPPPECGMACSAAYPCPDGFACGDDGGCLGLCEVNAAPDAIAGLITEPHKDVKQAHHFATMSFVVPESLRTVVGYEVKVSTTPIVDEASFEAAMPANGASLESVELRIPENPCEVEGAEPGCMAPLPEDLEPGELVTVDFGGLSPETKYYVAIRAIDECNASSPIEVATVTTKEIHFTTVSPCFVATAAYGTPMAEEIEALRRFRDQHLLTNAPGRAFVTAYYQLGPYAAAVIRESDTLRAATRALLRPFVAAAEWLTTDEPRGD